MPLGPNGVTGLPVTVNVVVASASEAESANLLEAVSLKIDKNQITFTFSEYGDNSQCPGPDRETRRCNEHPCAPQCSWTEWCPWSACSAYSACDTGISQRSRQCVGEPGCSCRGLAEESQQCRGSLPCTPPPPPVPTPC